MALMDITDINNVSIINAWELDTEEFYKKAEDIISALGPSLEIVLEDFIITDRTAKLSQAPWSLQLKGVVMFLAWKHYANSFTLQKPSDKAFAPNEKLKHVGFWFVGGEGHAQDAFRHVIVYLVNRYPQWAKNLIV